MKGILTLSLLLLVSQMIQASSKLDNIINKLLLFGAVLLYPVWGFACAEQYWPLDQQIVSLESFDNVVVLKVVEAHESENERYSRTLQIEALIERAINGDLKPGALVTAYQAEEYSSIGCPVTLVVNERYLMPLEVFKDGYKFSRDEFHTVAEGREFENLLQIIAKE